MTSPTSGKPADPLALLPTGRYVALLVLAAILGVPMAALAYVVAARLDPSAKKAPAEKPGQPPVPEKTSPASRIAPPGGS